MNIADDEMRVIIKKIGPPRSGKNPKIALDMDRIRAMDRAGFSPGQIADYFGVCRDTIKRRLHGECRRFFEK